MKLTILKTKVSWYPIRRQIAIFIVLGFMGLGAPFAALLLILFFFYRLLIEIYVRLFRSDLKRPLHGLSAMMTVENFTGKNSKFNVMVVGIADGHISLDAMIEIGQHRLRELKKANGELKYPELSQYPEAFGGYVFWKDDEKFDLRNHVRNYEDDSTRAQNPLYEKDLTSIINKIMAERWEEKRSPWEIIRISNYFPIKEDQTVQTKPHLAVILRCHHCLGDGYSGKKLFEDFANIKMKFPRLTVPTYSFWEKIMGPIYSLLRMPYDVAELTVDSIDGTNTLHQPDVKLSRDYMTHVMEEYYSAEKIKEIKDKFKVNYSSVLYTVMCGAIRRTLIDAGLEVPKRISCIAPLPLPFRPEGLTNHMWIFSLYLPLHLESPEERLEIIYNQMKKSKFFGGWIAFFIGNKLAVLVPKFVHALYYSRIQSTMISTVFPGPEEQIKDVFGLDLTLTDAFFLVGLPAGKMGIMSSSISSVGRQHFVFSMDKAVFPYEDSFNKIGKYAAEDLNNLFNSSKKKIDMV